MTGPAKSTRGQQPTPISGGARVRRLARIRTLLERLGLLAASPGENVYHAFISYSHAVDDQLAPAMQRALQRFAKPWGGHQDYKLALPPMDAVPASTPLKARVPLPATGPYRVATYDARHDLIRLVRNSRFHA